MHSLGMSDEVTPVGVSGEKLGGKESDSEKAHKIRNLNSGELQPSGAEGESMSK